MRTTVDKTGLRRSRGDDGRYLFETACDGCGRTIPTKAGALQHYTDDDVCDGGDGPGFFLCGCKDCLDLIHMSLEARRRVYTDQRRENDLAASEHRRPRRVRECLSGAQLKQLKTLSRGPQNNLGAYMVRLHNALGHKGLATIDYDGLCRITDKGKWYLGLIDRGDE